MREYFVNNYGAGILRSGQRGGGRKEEVGIFTNKEENKERKNLILKKKMGRGKR